MQYPAAGVLAALDELLSAAVRHATATDPRAVQDRWRGLRLDQEAVEILLERGTLLGGFRGSCSAIARRARDWPELALLADLYELSEFALAALLLALAPELDERYAKIYAFLQDDLTRRSASGALALSLLGAPGDIAQHRQAFASGGALLGQHLLELEPQATGARLNAGLRVDPQIRQFLLGESGIDPRLAAFAQLRAARAAEPAPFPAAAAAALEGVAVQLRRGEPVRLLLQGAVGCEHERAVELLGRAAGVPLLQVDVRALAEVQADLRLLCGLLRRQALLTGSLVVFRDGEALCSDAHARLRALLEEEFVRLAPGVVVIARGESWLPAAATRAGCATLTLERPGSAERAELWRYHLSTAGRDVARDVTELLARRFKLTPQQIAAAAAQSAAMLRLKKRAEGSDAAAALQAYAAAARAQGGHELEHLARRIAPRHGFEDLIVPDPVRAQLEEIRQRVVHSETVFGSWRFGERMSYGCGVSALFLGPAGTGKTMAAEVLAGALQLEVFKIDLASVVSKYIGETEQNLERVFRAATDVNGILFFDEADALFGKRSEVRDARDRYANLEISYLLQRMEEFPGIAILATNLQNNLDDAFLRRLGFLVYFPFPEAPQRLRIWQSAWSSAVPRDPELHFERIAHAFKLSGGHIKSAAVAAAHFAAADGGVVRLPHVLHAIEREYQKLGRTLRPEELLAVQGRGA
jgi:ATPase family associated with various cellular activities (AAA)/Winged helix domain, variant